MARKKVEDDEEVPDVGLSSAPSITPLDVNQYTNVADREMAAKINEIISSLT